jgi:biopolymer transport protein ExbD
MDTMKRKRRGADTQTGAVELNVMPFIDVFSLLTTFLLFSAVFIQIGVLEVQIPFLSNAKPPDFQKPERLLEVKVDLSKDFIEVSTSWTAAPVDEKKKQFQRDKAGIAEAHRELLSIRTAHPDLDKLTMFTEDEITYNELAEVLDAVKFLAPGETLPPPKDPSAVKNGEAQPSLFPKVIMGSVML